MVSPVPERVSGRWGYWRLGLGVLWLLLIASAALTGERVTPLPALDSAIASGRVTSVQVSGGLDPGHSGSALVEVRWTDGPIRHVTDVTQVSADSSATSSSTDRSAVTGDVGARLSADRPGLTVVREPFSFSSGATVLDWRVPQWAGAVAFFAAVGTLLCLVWGPTPWRATRWAWFWLMISPLGPVASLGFVLLSGPTPLIPAPRNVTRRVRAGWVVLGLILLSLVPWALLWPWL